MITIDLGLENSYRSSIRRIGRVVAGISFVLATISVNAVGAGPVRILFNYLLTTTNQKVMPVAEQTDNQKPHKKKVMMTIEMADGETIHEELPEFTLSVKHRLMEGTRQGIRTWRVCILLSLWISPAKFALSSLNSCLNVNFSM